MDSSVSVWIEGTDNCGARTEVRMQKAYFKPAGVDKDGNITYTLTPIGNWTVVRNPNRPKHKHVKETT